MCKRDKFIRDRGFDNKHITIYFKSNMSSNPLTLIKNRLYLCQEIHRDCDFHSLDRVYNGCRDRQLNQGVKTLIGT